MASSHAGAKPRSDDADRAMQEYLPSFEPVAFLGLFHWDGTKLDGKIAETPDLLRVQTEHILQCLRVPEKGDLKDGPPPINRSIFGIGMMYTGIRFPDPATLPPQLCRNVFPSEACRVVPLYVAVKHFGVKLEDVHFLLGGSSLNMLATGEIDNSLFDQQGGRATIEYVVQRVPACEDGGGPIAIVKSHAYVANFADIGYQFERMCTCKGDLEESLRERHQTDFYESMRLVKIGPYLVLFSAEVDAVDSDGSGPHASLVEVKAANPYFYGYKTLLQMLASNSKFLIQADSRGPAQAKTLLGVEKKPWRALFEDCTVQVGTASKGGGKGKKGKPMMQRVSKEAFAKVDQNIVDKLSDILVAYKGAESGLGVGALSSGAALAGGRGSGVGSAGNTGTTLSMCVDFDGRGAVFLKPSTRNLFPSEKVCRELLG